MRKYLLLTINTLVLFLKKTEYLFYYRCIHFFFSAMHFHFHLVPQDCQGQPAHFQISNISRLQISMTHERKYQDDETILPNPFRFGIYVYKIFVRKTSKCFMFSILLNETRLFIALLLHFRGRMTERFTLTDECKRWSNFDQF